ncbi:unnamed protein product, partial [Ixodes hexagonus]
TKRKKAAADAQLPKEPEAKKQEQLLEKIAEEQKAQKKILEDLQRELKQEIAKHKDSDSEKANKTVPKAEPAKAQPPVNANVQPEVPPKQTEPKVQRLNLQQHVQKDSKKGAPGLQAVPVELPAQQNAVREPAKQPVQPVVNQPLHQNVAHLVQQKVERLAQRQALPALQKDSRPQNMEKLDLPIQQLQAAQKSLQDGVPQPAAADDRPLAEKMSMDVKRDAPPISIPIVPAAVQDAAAMLQPKDESKAADGAAVARGVVDQKKAD